MKQNFTEEDIIRFLFNEMPSQESNNFLDALCKDEELWENFEKYQQVSDKLVPIQLTPSDQSIQHIMDFVSDTQEVAGKKSGKGFTSSRVNTLLLSGLILLATGTILGSVYHGKIADPSGNAISQQQEAVLLDWEEKELDLQIESIKEEIQNLKQQNEATKQERKTL